jgi:two-component system sensor histidine kinase/response regulator
VLMDLQMPVLDGLAATRRLRASGVRLPIIAMTAHALKEDVERCYAAGMDDFIAKPIDPAHLFKTLTKWLAPATQTTPTQDAGSASPSPVSPPESPAELALPGIDTAAGLAHANGNAALYRKLLLRLREDWADLPTTVRIDLDAGETESARRGLHSLKGVAGNLGATELQGRAARAEASCRDGTLRPGDPTWNAMTEELSRVIDGLSTLSTVAPSTDSAAPVEGAGTADLNEALKALARALDDDFEQAKSLLNELREPLIMQIGEARVAEIGAMMERFDIDSAINAVDAIIDRKGNTGTTRAADPVRTE